MLVAVATDVGCIYGASPHGGNGVHMESGREGFLDSGRSLNTTLRLASIGSILHSPGGNRRRVRSIQARSRELETQVANRTRELEALNAVSAAVSRSLDLEKILADAPPCAGFVPILP